MSVIIGNNKSASGHVNRFQVWWTLDDQLFSR